MQDIILHEMIQTYFDKLYAPLEKDIYDSLFSESNEIYGELPYYSITKLIEYLNITEKDEILDIGSGLGRFIFQIFLTTPATSAIGIEINEPRHNIAKKIGEIIKKDFPELSNNKILNLLHGDFLIHDFESITIVYVCSVVFSNELLIAISQKLNKIDSVQKVVSLRKLPHLDNFSLSKKLFLQGTWDNSVCYCYIRKA